MFEVTKRSQDRVDITISGQIDADQMRQSMDALITACDGMRDGAMLYRITDFAMPTLGALAVEVGQLPKLFGLLKSIGRCAVLSDTGWIRKAAETEGRLIPGLTIKSFSIGDETEAEAWLLSS